jgi:PAS domain S-box-containing protein
MNEPSIPMQDVQKGLQPEDLFYRELFELNPAPMWAYDQETFRFLAVNEAALRLYGYSRDEFLRLKLSDFSIAERRAASSAAGAIDPSTIIWQSQKADGTPFELEVTACPVRIHGKNARLMVGHAYPHSDPAVHMSSESASDLTKPPQEQDSDFKSPHDALTESQERFRQMAENIRDVFWLSNPTMTSIIYVSPAYQTIWGRPCKELYENPRSWFEGLHPEDRPRLRRFYRKPIPEKGYEHTYRVVRPDGSVRWVMDRGFPVRNQMGEFYRLVAIARDITERKELETEILAISEREQRRIGQDLHDDLCQQLVGIEFLSKALEHQLKTSPQAEQASEIAQLIREAIEHTRLLARGLAPILLEAEGLMEALRSLAARTSHFFRVECSFRCPAPTFIHEVTVATYLYRIAQEAITNAIKHGKAKTVEIRLATTSDSLMLAIQDDGVGFSEKGRSFSGMGLRIMQYRADLIGGHFMIETGPGAGTTVICTVPLAAVKSPTQKKREPTAK